MRALNQRRILDALRRRGEGSRAEIAAQTGMSRPTAGKIIDAMLTSGLLEQRGARDAGGAPAGRPGRPVGLESRTPRFVLVELGVRRTALAAVAVSGPTEERWQTSFETPRRSDTWAERLAAAARDLPIEKPWRTVVSIPGVVDETEGRVLLAPNLHWAESARLEGLARRAFPGQVSLVQEVRALALGQLAAAPEERDFLIVDVGDGIGAAIVRGGALYDGALPLSGEIGHARVPGNDRVCGCGATGCLETLMAEPRLAGDLARATGRRHLAMSALTPRILERGIEPWLERALDATASVIGATLNAFGLRRVILTGALSGLPGLGRAALASAISDSSMWARFGTVDVEFAPRRRMAGLAAVALDRLVLPGRGATRRTAP